MTRTLSGHRAIKDESDPALQRVTVEGWTLIAHKDYAELLGRVAQDWHDTVHPLRLDPLECWSFDFRPPRIEDNTSLVSDHAGFAIDLNSAHEGAQGPNGGMATMTSAQRAACEAIAERYKDCVGWGGHYRHSSAWDPMHWYINSSATPQRARELLELENDVALSDDDIEKIAQRASDLAAEKVWKRAFREYVDEDKDGIRETRSVADILYSTHRAAVQAAAQSPDK